MPFGRIIKTCVQVRVHTQYLPKVSPGGLACENATKEPIIIQLVSPKVGNFDESWLVLCLIETRKQNSAIFIGSSVTSRLDVSNYFVPLFYTYSLIRSCLLKNWFPVSFTKVQILNHRRRRMKLGSTIECFVCWISWKWNPFSESIFVCLFGINWSRSKNNSSEFSVTCKNKQKIIIRRYWRTVNILVPISVQMASDIYTIKTDAINVSLLK